MSIVPNNVTNVLCWPKKLLSADDLRLHLTNQRELQLLPRTIITPLAVDELKAKGIRVVWQVSPVMSAANGGVESNRWFYAQEKHDTMISSVLQALSREGIVLSPLETMPGPWVVRFAELILANHAGGVAMVREPGLICCIANKVAGIRAASVHDVPQVASVKKSMGANLFAMDGAGKTFFEVRQMLRTITASAPTCGEGVAKTLSELDGHAHR